jgi:hypothetical protein
MLGEALSWIDSHPTLTVVLATVSVASFIGSILLLHALVAAMPEDYFVDSKRHHSRFHHLHPILYVGLRVLKNGLGWLLIVAGIVMLVLPGQGLLTILVGLVLSDFPGKFTLERRLAGNRKVMEAFNWLRRRVGRPPLRSPSPSED